MVTTKQVVDRLKQFGYEVSAEENTQVDFELNLTLDYVKNYCNIEKIPLILDNRIVDKVCSAYLFNRKNTGKLEGFDYDAVIKQIKDQSDSADILKENNIIVLEDEDVYPEFARIAQEEGYKKIALDFILLMRRIVFN